MFDISIDPSPLNIFFDLHSFKRYDHLGLPFNIKSINPIQKYPHSIEWYT